MSGFALTLPWTWHDTCLPTLCRPYPAPYCEVVIGFIDILYHTVSHARCPPPPRPQVLKASEAKQALLLEKEAAHSKTLLLTHTHHTHQHNHKAPAMQQQQQRQAGTPGKAGRKQQLQQLDASEEDAAVLLDGRFDGSGGGDERGEDVLGVGHTNAGAASDMQHDAATPAAAAAAAARGVSSPKQRRVSAGASKRRHSSDAGAAAAAAAGGVNGVAGVLSGVGAPPLRKEPVGRQEAVGLLQTLMKQRKGT